MPIEVGAKAPDFELPDQFMNPVKLSDFRGEKNVVLVFFSAAFSSICEGEMCSVRDELADLDTGEVQVITVSTDTPFVLRQWADQQGYKFSLLSDFWPHGKISRVYDVFDEQFGVPTRGTFVIDKTGTVRWRVLNAIPDIRDAGEYRTALAAL